MTSPDLDLHDLEGRLRDATAAYAETVEPAPDAWAHLRGRVDGDATRRRWTRVGAGLAIGAAVAAAAIAGAIALTDDPDGGLVVETPPAGGTTGPAPVPPRAGGTGIVYATNDALVVVDAAGNEQGVSLDPGGTVRQLQASADGTTLWYLDVPAASAPCGTIRSRALPLAGTEVTDLGIAATAFAVSPDGGRIAYATRGSACDPSSQLAFVVVRDLAGPGGSEQVWAHEPGLDSDGALLPDTLAWSPDGTRLAVGLCTSEQSCSVSVLDPSTSGRLLEAAVVEGTGRYPVWAGPSQLAVVVGPESDSDPEAHAVLGVDVDRGASSVLVGDLGATLLTGLAHDPATGDLLLIFEDGTVAQWSGADLAEVAGDATAAAFVTVAVDEPPSATSVPSGAPALAPGTVVYATSGNRVLTGDGQELAVLPDGVAVRSLAVGSDGRLWGLTVPAGVSGAPCGTLTDRLDDPSAAAVTLAVSEFALSPNGSRLAYVARGDSGCEMGDDGRVFVRDVATGEERVVAAHDSAAGDQPYPLYPGRLAWSPDGAWLAIERCWEGCDVVVVPASTTGAALGDLGSAIVAAFPAFLPDGRLVVADGGWNRDTESSDPSLVFSFALEPGEGETLVARSGEEIASSASPIQGVWSDPASGRLLLLIDGTLTLRGGDTPGSIDVDVVAATFVRGPVSHDPAPGTTVPATSAPAACSAAGQGIRDIAVATGPVEVTRQAILEAAVACDWDALRALMADDFSYSFGGELDADEAIAAWQEAESRGEPILATLAGRMYETPRASDGFFTFEDPADPLAYRAVVAADGTWTAFVAGD